MKAVGLTDLDFAGFCKDVITKEVEGEDGTISREAELGANGEKQYIYSLRYEEFIALNTFMIKELYKELQSIKKALETK